MKRASRFATRYRSSLWTVIGGALLLSGTPKTAQAVDPYVRKLEERIDALEREQRRSADQEQKLAGQQQRSAQTERELDLLASDARGKDLSSAPATPPSSCEPPGRCKS